VKKSIILSVLLTSVVACTTSQSGKSFNTHTADFSKASDDELCIVYGYRLNRSGEAKSELIKRKSLQMLNGIKSQSIKFQMECLSVQLRLLMRSVIKRCRTPTLIMGDKGKSFIYSCTENNVPHCPYTKIDMINGKVTSISSVQKI